MYVSRTAGFRKADECPGLLPIRASHCPARGCPTGLWRPYHWPMSDSKGLQAPQCLRAHSTRGMATSWALFRGVSVKEICAAASWATPHTEILQGGCSLAQAVLEATAPGSV